MNSILDTSVKSSFAHIHESGVSRQESEWYFISPWHKYIHGLGLGQNPQGYDATKARYLLDIDRLLLRKFRTSYQILFHRLLHWVLECGEQQKTGVHILKDDTCQRIFDALAEIKDSIEYAKACCLLVESFIKLGYHDRFRHKIQSYLFSALAGLHAYTYKTEKERYDALHLYANLIRVSAMAGWSGLLLVGDKDRPDYIKLALDSMCALQEPFYRARVGPLLMTILALHGNGERVFNSEHDYLLESIDFLDKNWDKLSAYPADGVHSGFDFQFFSLCLNLIAITAINRPDCARYKKNWPQIAKLLYDKLTDRSKASQSLFYIQAMDGILTVEDEIGDRQNYLKKCLNGYLTEGVGKEADEYLRATYLIHLSYYLNRVEDIPSVLWQILENRLKFYNNHGQSGRIVYDSNYMAVAYILSAHNLAGRMYRLFSSERSVLSILGNINESTIQMKENIPKLDYVLLDIALQQRTRTPEFIQKIN